MKLPNPFKKPTALELAHDALEDARRQHLLHLSQRDYHTNMANYYEQTVRRLSAYVQSQEK